MSYTQTRSTTFTISEARKLGAKVEADLYLCWRHYDQPTLEAIPRYAEELAQLLKDGYVQEYEFGFKSDNKRVLCWRYRVAADGSLQADDRPGQVYAHADVSGATFYNFMTYSTAWYALGSVERARIKAALPVSRGDGSLPDDGNGYWISDKTYSAANVGLGRSTYRPY